MESASVKNKNLGPCSGEELQLKNENRIKAHKKHAQNLAIPIHRQRQRQKEEEDARECQMLLLLSGKTFAYHE